MACAEDLNQTRLPSSLISQKEVGLSSDLVTYIAQCKDWSNSEHCIDTPAVVNVKKFTSCGQFEDFLSLVSVDKTKVTGKIFLVPRYILKIKECHVINF